MEHLSVSEILDFLKNPTVVIAIVFCLFLSGPYALWGGLLFGSVFAGAFVRSIIGLLPNPVDEGRREAYFSYVDKASWWIAIPLWVLFWPQFLGYFYQLVYGIPLAGNIEEDVRSLLLVALVISASALLMTLWAWWLAVRATAVQKPQDSAD